MNKKLILGLTAIVIAIVIIIIAIVGITNKLGSGKDINSDINSSLTNSDASNSSVVSSDDKNVVSNYIVNSNIEPIVEVEKPNKDTIIAVPILVADNPDGFYAGQFTFTYDAKSLTYIDYDKGNLFEEYESATDTGKVSFIINAAEIKDVKGSGKLVILKFKANDGAKAGDYHIKLASSSIGTADGKLVTPIIKNGIITIK